MIVVSLPGMIALLLPVVVIEALFIFKRTSLPTLRVFKATALANVASTLIGVPLAWCASLLCEAVIAFGLVGLSKVAPELNEWNSPAAKAAGTVISAAWIGDGPTWTVPLAALTLLVPSFFASVWIERKIMRWSLLATTAGLPQGEEISDRVLRSLVRDANLLSYAFLAAVCGAWLMWGVIHP
jgi:hypothetical protein